MIRSFAVAVAAAARILEARLGASACVFCPVVGDCVVRLSGAAI